MAIYRGPGGSGDATGDAANEALVAQEAAQNAAASATAAANSATNAATSATNAANSATSSATSAASSATSATSASNSATSAANSATAAQTAETNAETAETNANASAALAQDWATKTSGPVAGGEYSSKYNAQLAATSASNASTSASNAASSASSASSSATSASNSASTATTKASEASASASAAATSASNAATSESNAASSASSASSSAASASNSASTATTKAGEAATSASNAATSEANALTYSNNAASSASSAATSATNASNSASSASTSATNAASSASAAATSASNASASETAAAGSATSAANSASAASTSATNAANSATSASNSASSASTSASNAATSASNAATSESNAASSASSASSSASAASTSASNAATSASNAATSESNTASLYDQFDDRYLGNKSSDPTLDNDGNALLEGALYWNTSTKILRIYNGTSWQNTVSTSSGTVTSVDMSVPTGLSVSGNPITTAGTLALSYTAGYSIPTDTEQANWDTAYSWGNHATAGCLTSLGIGSLTQAWDADLDAIAALSGTTGLLRKTAANTWSLDTNTYLTTGAIGSSVLAYDSNLQSFVNTFTLPTTDGTNGQVLRTDGSGVLSFVTPSVVAALDDLTDVVITSPTTNQVLQYNGTNWVNATSSGGSSFPAGTRLAFQQTSAPTGWTKDTTAALNDSIMRIVTGTASSGGSTAFSTYNGVTSVGATTLSSTEIPAHSHQQRAFSTTNKVPGMSWSNNGGANQNAVTTNVPTTNNTGGGGSHTHTITRNIKYYDFIIASKD